MFLLVLARCQSISINPDLAPREEIVGNLLPEMEVTIRSDTSPEHFASQSLKLEELSRPTCALCASHSCPKCSSTTPSSSSSSSLSFTSVRFFSSPVLLLLLLRIQSFYVSPLPENTKQGQRSQRKHSPLEMKEKRTSLLFCDIQHMKHIVQIQIQTIAF